MPGFDARHHRSSIFAVKVTSRPKATTRYSLKLIMRSGIFKDLLVLGLQELALRRRIAFNAGDNFAGY